MAEVAFALVLNLHQPAGNLEDLLRTARVGGPGDPVGDGPDPPVAVGLRRCRPGAPVAVRHPAGDLGQSRLPAPRLRHRRLRVAAVVPAEHHDHPHPGHRLLPSRPAPDPPCRLGRAARALAGDRPAPVRADQLPRVLAPGDGLLHGAHPRPQPPALPLRARRQRARRRGHPHGLGRTALPAAHRPVRRRGDHRGGPGPGAVRRPGGRDGRRLVHARGGPADQALRLPAPRDHLHRRG